MKSAPPLHQICQFHHPLFLTDPKLRPSISRKRGGGLMTLFSLQKYFILIIKIDNDCRRNVPKSIFSTVRPTPFKTKPKLVSFSTNVLRYCNTIKTLMKSANENRKICKILHLNIFKYCAI